MALDFSKLEKYGNAPPKTYSGKEAKSIVRTAKVKMYARQAAGAVPGAVKSGAELAGKGLQKGFDFVDSRSGYISTSRNLGVAPMITKEQRILRELFRGEQTFGTGNNLPNTDEQMLRKGGGLIKNGDVFRKTGRMFGLR